MLINGTSAAAARRSQKSAVAAQAIYRRRDWRRALITATYEIRWRRKVVERGSRVVDVRRRPISDTNSKACTLQTPELTMAKGMKSTPAIMSSNLRDLLSYTFRAAEPACKLLSQFADWA